MRMFAAAAEKAKSLDPVKVAAALEGMEFDVYNGGKGTMRKDDHQFFQPMYIASIGERTDKEPFDEEKTGWGWKIVAKIDTAADSPADDLQDGSAELIVRATRPSRHLRGGRSLSWGPPCLSSSSFPR